MPILHEPKIRLEGVRIRSATLTSLNLDVVIRVENKNPVGATLREIPFIILLRDGGGMQEIANGNTGNISIPANNSTKVTVPVTSHNAAILKALATFVAKGGIDVTIKGNAVVDAVVTGWSVPFEKTVTVTMDQVAGALSERPEQ
jgi:LEA14-like dessication related protein